MHNGAYSQHLMVVFFYVFLTQSMWYGTMLMLYWSGEVVIYIITYDKLMGKGHLI